MNAESIEEYRRYHRQRLQSQKQALEQKRRRILQHIDKAATVLEKLGANHAILFGSVLNPNRFHSRSDLDLIVYGLSLSQWLSAFIALENIEELSDIEIDLKRAEELPEEFLSYVESQGKQLLK